MLDNLPILLRWHVEELGKKSDPHLSIWTLKLTLIIKTKQKPNEKNFFNIKLQIFIFCRGRGRIFVKELLMLRK